MALGTSSQDTTGGLIPPGSVGPVPALAPDWKYLDMNPTTGGVNRGTNIGSSWRTLFNLSGAGLLFGFLVTVQSGFNNWFIRLIVDGNELFTTTGLPLEDVEDSDKYGWEKDKEDALNFLGINIIEDTFRWEDRYPTSFSQSVQILARRTGGSKDFKAGLVKITSP